jgi:transcriptional regulator of arginine metabolism
MPKQKKLTTTARRTLVQKIVSSELIHSQQELVHALRREGVQVTQATASRDLEELGAVRGPDEKGQVRYQFPISATPNYGRVSTQLFLSVRSAGNQIVIRTPAGGAQLLAGAIDRAASRGEMPNILGTIAGDDTVLIICENESQSRTVIERVSELFAGGSLPLARGKKRRGGK